MNGVKKKPMSRMLLYVALLLIVVWAMIGLRTCSVDTPFRAVEQRPAGGDTLDVAIEYSPLSMYRYDDTLGGFNYDLLRLLERDFGFVFKFHPVSNFDLALGKLNDGLYDLVVADIPMTSELEGRFLFTEPVFLSRQVLVQLRDSAGAVEVRNRLDLAGKEVTVSRGSSAGMRLRNLAEEIGDTIFAVEDTINGSEQLFLLTAAGSVKYAVVNEYLARKMSPKFPMVDLSTEVSFTQFQSWILGKDNAALKQRLDSSLVEIKQTDDYRALERRYLQ